MTDVRFFTPGMPSANSVLLRGERVVLVDAGLGSDVPGLLAWLEAQGNRPEDLSLLLLTHHHSDHVGGANALQSRFGARVAMHAWEADLVNRRAPEACSAVWLDQPVEAFTVDERLQDGSEIDLGSEVARVLHTPGHTLGHVSVWLPDSRVLIAGDTVHEGDTAWVNPFLEGAGGADRLVASLERMAALGARTVLTGHGPALRDPDAAFAAGINRARKWQADPERMLWHGLKRTFAYALMLRGGLSKGEVETYLLARAWLHYYARAFGVAPSEMARLSVAEMLRSGAASWLDGRLLATTPHRVPEADWLRDVLATHVWGAPATRT